MPDLFQTPDDEALALVRLLLSESTHAALAVQRPGAPGPSVTRIALACDPTGAPMSLISTLAPHTAALQADPACALLVGDPGAKGDPLTHPRLTLHATARFVPADAPERPALRAHYLAQRPKAQLYVDFADFGFVLFDMADGLLNAGFGKAYVLSPADLNLT